MNIVSVRIRKENLELARPYAISYKTVSRVENVIVEMRLASGVVGCGACNPSKAVVGVSVEDSFDALNADDFAWLIGRDIREFQRLCYDAYAHYPNDMGACAALDIALHDAFAKHLDVPLVKFLGQKIDALPTSITIGIKNVRETLEEATEYIERGFQILKVKIGNSLEEDIERLVKLRERFGDAVGIRVDANQGYDARALAEFVEQTAPLRLELIEQPFPVGAVEAMKSLPENIKQKIAADESLLNTADAIALVSEPRACGIFNIKLMKCGGVTGAREIAVVAENAGVALMWGCNDESAISISAALHAAFASTATKYIDLDGSLDLARDVVSGGFELKNGIMRPLDAAGLGVET